MYHHVSDRTPASTSVTPAIFDQHLEFLENNGFRIWALPEVVDRLGSGASLPDSVVVITFDDGYRSVYEEAFPRLQERGWPFTVFVSSEAIDKGEGPVATWEQLAEMSRAGATIASHGEFHHHMPRLGPGEITDQWRTRVQAELEHSQKRILAKTGQNHDLLAYPFGETSEDLLDLVREMGWTAFGQQSGAAGPLSDPTCLPRYPMAANFASLETFPVKVASLPLPVAEVQAAQLELSISDDSVIMGAEPPLLRLRLAAGKYQADQLVAYASGQGKITGNWDATAGVFEVQAPAPLRPGRSRYNITAPDLTGRRWYWYSHTWVVGEAHDD